MLNLEKVMLTQTLVMLNLISSGHCLQYLYRVRHLLLMGSLLLNKTNERIDEMTTHMQLCEYLSIIRPNVLPVPFPDETLLCVQP